MPQVERYARLGTAVRRRDKLDDTTAQQSIGAVNYIEPQLAK